MTTDLAKLKLVAITRVVTFFTNPMVKKAGVGISSLVQGKALCGKDAGMAQGFALRHLFWGLAGSEHLVA
jgi:hypothetical protein